MPYINPAAVDGQAFASVVFGFRVERAGAALPQSAQGALFTVAGGRIALLGIVGEVTTAIQNQANNTKVVANPTGGVDVDLCAVLSIADDAVGVQYGITGVPGDAMVGAGGAAPLPQRPVAIKPGTIDLSCSASNTGAVAWTLWYVPLDEGATVVAA